MKTTIDLSRLPEAFSGLPSDAEIELLEVPAGASVAVVEERVEVTLDDVLDSLFKVTGDSSLVMRVGTPDGWVEVSSDKRPVFVETGEDATDAAREWFESKGL